MAPAVYKIKFCEHIPPSGTHVKEDSTPHTSQTYTQVIVSVTFFDRKHTMGHKRETIDSSPNTGAKKKKKLTLSNGRRQTC